MILRALGTSRTFIRISLDEKVKGAVIRPCLPFLCSLSLMKDITNRNKLF